MYHNVFVVVKRTLLLAVNLQFFMMAFSVQILILFAALISVSVSNDICNLPPDAGTCEAIIPMYFFNSSAHTCQNFIYGGCDGNENKFETLEECQAACPDKCVGKSSGSKWSKICELPSDTGPCDGSFVRFYYNSVCGRCERFSYGGCGGNDNRFDTLTDCIIACDS